MADSTREELERRIRTLEWDSTHNQINPAKAAKLEKLKKELAALPAEKSN